MATPKKAITLDEAEKLSLKKSQIYVPSAKKSVSRKEITPKQIQEIIERSPASKDKYFEDTVSMAQRLKEEKEKGKEAQSQLDEMRAEFKAVTGEDAPGGATPKELVSLLADAMAEKAKAEAKAEAEAAAGAAGAE